MYKEYHVRIISKKILREFWEKHADSQQQLTSWFRETSNVEWKSPAEIKREYPSASFLQGNRVVFNIKGNDYRMIVVIAYRMQYVYVKFIGTHADYDKVDAAVVDQFKGD